MPVQSVQPVTREQVPYLDADMTPADIIEVLANLRFRINRDREQFCLIELDRGVADYFIGLLRGH
jgi:hypothetical protein